MVEYCGRKDKKKKVNGQDKSTEEGDEGEKEQERGRRKCIYLLKKKSAAPTSKVISGVFKYNNSVILGAKPPGKDVAKMVGNELMIGAKLQFEQYQRVVWY